MVGPDPVDTRLLALIAEAGRASVTDMAHRLGMDVREVAARLAALSAAGLPLVVGVECDQQAIRNVLMAAGAWAQHQYQSYPPGPPPGYPAPAPPGYPVHGTPSGSYPPPGSGSGPYPPPGSASGAYPPAHHPGAASGPYPHPAPGFPPPGQAPPSGPFPAPPPGPAAPPHPAPAAQEGAPSDPASVWGPPQSASWARGDGPPAATPAPPRAGQVGTALETHGVEGERVRIQLLEVVDPANFLFEAAGYTLQEGERAVVVHTEITNQGPLPFAALPDLYLVLVTEDDQPVSKAPVSLSSRPAYRIGVGPGETAGGHSVYVLPDSTRVTSVRWSPGPDPDHRTLTWTVDED
ncbi:AsnC family protein [Actinoalloteichus caeruleus]|uniref:AsnC family protein n=1 Tax=Actinoalloteichus cyanogriseus TaxID=2893586 RepID=UPI0004AA61BD|nr:AsnC family protein [Actinoalloteichus caeruleus]